MNEWKYILAEDGKTPIPEPDVIKWARWYEKTERHVAFDEIGSIKISTVFLGIDHGFDYHNERPILWETMIFGATGELEHYQERYSSYQEAMEGHERAVAQVMEEQGKQ